MRKLAMLLILTGLVISMAFGQETKKVEEPEYLGIYNFLDVSKGSLAPLERQTVSYKFKTKAMGFGGAKSTIEIKGGKSTVRFKEDQEIVFVVRVGSQQTDPATIVQFVKFDAKKDKRTLTVGKVGAMGIGGSTVDMNAGATSFNAAKYGESSFKIVPAQKLKPGEYGLSSSTSNDVFCFGIDPADAKQ